MRASAVAVPLLVLLVAGGCSDDEERLGASEGPVSCGVAPARAPVEDGLLVVRAPSGDELVVFEPDGEEERRIPLPGATEGFPTTAPGVGLWSDDERAYLVAADDGTVTPLGETDGSLFGATGFGDAGRFAVLRAPAPEYDQLVDLASGALSPLTRPELGQVRRAELSADETIVLVEGEVGLGVVRTDDPERTVVLERLEPGESYDSDLSADATTALLVRAGAEGREVTLLEVDGEGRRGFGLDRSGRADLVGDCLVTSQPREGSDEVEVTQLDGGARRLVTTESRDDATLALGEAGDRLVLQVLGGPVSIDLGTGTVDGLAPLDGFRRPVPGAPSPVGDQGSGERRWALLPFAREGASAVLDVDAGEVRVVETGPVGLVYESADGRHQLTIGDEIADGDPSRVVDLADGSIDEVGQVIGPFSPSGDRLALLAILADDRDGLTVVETADPRRTLAVPGDLPVWLRG